MPFDEGFDDVFFAEREIQPSDLVLQEEEVEEAVWASEEKIITMIEEGTFIPYHPEMISLFFALCNRGGMHASAGETGSAPSSRMRKRQTVALDACTKRSVTGS